MNCDHCLCLWVVYLNPTDLPGKHVLRRQWVLCDDKQRGAIVRSPGALVAPGDVRGLEDIRQCIPPGLQYMPRLPEDDPVILETWL